MSEINVGTRVRLIPSGWTDTGNGELPAYVKKSVDGEVEYVNEKTGVFRVGYTAKGDRCHETFKLALVDSDRIRILG